MHGSETNPLWGPDWPAVRDLWDLDPEVDFLNHGSFGACPRPVLERQAALRAEMERRPVEFLSRRLPEMITEACARVAAFLRADPDGLAFVSNATTGVATVLASLELRPGHEVLVTDHAYPAVMKSVGRACARAGATRLVVPVPLPLPDPRALTALIGERLSPRTQLAVIDHVTSATAALLPVASLVSACHEHGVPVLVDAAHAPGMVEVDIDALGAEFWTGNLHKWVCAPKGSGVMWVRADLRDRVHPLVTSHGAGAGFLAEFDWTGTHDPTPYLSVGAALDLFEELGWERVRRHNHDLAILGRELVAAEVDSPALVPEQALGSMAVVRLPSGVATTEEQALALQARLYREHRVEVPIGAWNGQGLLRLSAQAYNCPAQYERLASALGAVLA